MKNLLAGTENAGTLIKNPLNTKSNVKPKTPTTSTTTSPRDSIGSDNYIQPAPAAAKAPEPLPETKNVVGTLMARPTIDPTKRRHKTIPKFGAYVQQDLKVLRLHHLKARQNRHQADFSLANLFLLHHTNIIKNYKFPKTPG